VTILSKLDHPHILNVYEYFEDENHLYIVTELCTGGELFDKIIEKKRFTEAEAVHAMEQILSAVVFCHGEKIVHRDLKPENILYASKKADSIIRVIDFGTSVQTKRGNLDEKIGTVIFLILIFEIRPDFDYLALLHRARGFKRKL
jgi:calcium-dependent protein kinase